MAEENQNTDLAVSDGAAALPSTDAALDAEQSTQDPDASEQSASSNSIFGDLDMVRQLILVLAVAICVALIMMLFFWVQEPEMRPLGTYETEELIPVLDHLDQNKVEYQLDGNTIRVPSSDYSSIRLGLTRVGLNTSTAEGDEILLNDMGFGVSQKLEQERLKLSRERQLAAAIEEVRQVRKARVLLAMPKQSVFVRHNQEASATVFLTLGGTNTLGQEEVDSIVDMVASAVPSLKPTRVTVTDQHGRLLNSGSEDPASAARRKEYELERKQERQLREKIDSILIPVLGLGNYTSQVDVSLDFSSLEETQRQFNPNTPATRSEYTREDYNGSDRVAGIPGALSNQPPADASIPEDVRDLKNGAGGTGSVSRESTRNFELDTTIRHRRAQSGVIDRQTVSVAVNFKQSVDPETGDTVKQPLSDDELAKIRRLLMGGVGFSEQRGDVLEVIAVPFVEPEQAAEQDVPIWDHPNFNDWVRWLAAALVIIVIIVVLVRPAMKKLLYPNTDEDGNTVGPNGEILGPDGLPVTPDGDDVGLIGSELDGSSNFAMSASDVELPNLHKDEDLLKAVRALVANEPDLAAQAVKNWVTEDGK
ncbi:MULTISPECIES: flagellar basal-body MS-ring/collar protein FliF [unclassified Salinivibrio]|uniref:flagellar basal-body MS-ring/collar protein FliF n=1 Tax=unclassified Salinivibrio TaxID=2636825 RepID=UPI0012BE2CE1|nr:flagellar basal body M-ring protein FliF [Salinivibrio sp. VYel7]MPX91146.1 flagellar basal body M-ring protein FliF [Salinivibrio sp. VYel1]MPX94337.1 flagellar basal body M-ring protein FliF [Salinivibrio sp. VYel9]MPX96241.1 flagellar basal body M-ring protein FliF [Salinivibrio sp. VYel6]MPY00623.1 flagellar basal body M-ring protein FliF [Salinivibrio sp. VYel4]MPY03636.1 flagellar basal body M-ring protein FliF [Salinivibrio sp. VYel5]MPY06616.1 flagellar basal body M-ring protein Fl